MDICDNSRIPRFLKLEDTNKFDIQKDLGRSNIIPTPHHIVDRMLDLLPKDIWSNPDIRFLDPCCKSGAYLEKIYWRLEKGLVKKYLTYLKEITIY